MFKLKPGNVFQKINKMDKKQAYTWGAIVIVCFIALITLASFMGNADETSFDGLNTRGYDLAQMPFVNDEAEEYLLASKYPDMQGNNSTMLYSSAEKEARQEEDAAKAAEEGGEGADADASADGGYAGYSGGGYSGGGYAGGGAGSTGPTQVGQLGAASMSRSGGSGVSGSWGAPRGDFSPYKTQEKGSELPVQFKNNDARRALSQFAQTSRAAAGFRDSKGANAKRALMGGNVQGSEAFTDGGVDLSKSGGLALDTNAPVSTADLSNLDKDISDAANKAKEDKDEEDKDISDMLREQFLSGLVQMGVQAIGGLVNKGIDSIFASIDAWSAQGTVDNNVLDSYRKMTPEQLSQIQPSEVQVNVENGMKNLLGDTYDSWKSSNQTMGDFSTSNNVNLKQNLKDNREGVFSFASSGADSEGNPVMTLGPSNELMRAEAKRTAWLPVTGGGSSPIDTSKIGAPVNAGPRQGGSLSPELQTIQTKIQNGQTLTIQEQEKWNKYSVKK